MATKKVSRHSTILFILWVVAGLAVGCGESSRPASPSPTAPASLPTATVPPSPTATAVPPTSTPTPTVVMQLETSVVCFEYLSSPDDEEGLMTQIGVMPEVKDLRVVTEDNAMTVTYDSAEISRNRIVGIVRNLGFPVIDCP